MMRWLLAVVLALFMLAEPLAAQAAIDIKPTEQLPQVMQKSQIADIAISRLERALREAGETRRHTIDVRTMVAGLRLPEGKISYEAFIPGGYHYGMPTMVRIDVKINGELYKRLNCSMMIHLYDNVVVTTRQIKPENLITADDIRLEEREIFSRNSFRYYTSLDAFDGMVSTKALNEGTIIYDYFIKPPIVVRFGMPVTIRSNINGVQVAVDGIARDNGRIGQIIKVKNQSSGRIVGARVLDENTVLIEK